MLGSSVRLALLAVLAVGFSASGWLTSTTTTAVDAFAPAVQYQHRRASSTAVAQESKSGEAEVDDWELADGISEPVPTTVEIFLKKKFPEFYFVLMKNEDVLKVIREEETSKVGVTFFAPNSAAFEKLGSKRLQQLEDERNLETVEKVAAYHVVANEALQANRLFMEDWTKGRPKDGSPPAFTVEGIRTMGGVIPVGRSRSGGFFGFGAKEDGDAVIGTNNAKIVRSYFVGKDRKDCIVHEVDGLVSPELLWRYADQLRIPGF